MTDDGTPRRRALVAAVLWLVLALCLWNVRFDWGVRVCAAKYLDARSAYLNGRGPRVELAEWMDRGIADSVRAATVLAAPAMITAIGLIAYAVWRPDSSRARL
jgi:hypothetical protein